jgi:hypothetical protein
VPTKAGRQSEVLFLIYGPEKAFFGKTWTLRDLESTQKLNAGEPL